MPPQETPAKAKVPGAEAVLENMTAPTSSCMSFMVDAAPFGFLIRYVQNLVLKDVWKIQSPARDAELLPSQAGSLEHP